MSYPTDWVQQQLNFIDGNRTGDPPITTTTGTASEGGGGTSAPTNNDHGRRARPIRRRPRASRRTPTTLLNTDTTNFRAMVQQFTGGPATASTPHLSNATGIFDFRQHIIPNLQGGGAQVQYPVPNQMHVQQQRRHVFTVDEAHAPPGSSAPNGSRGYDNYML